MSTEIKEMEALNQAQANYYNNKKESKNLATNIWWFMREKVMGKFRKEYNINKDVIELHKNWLGDLSEKRVLDLGCFAGNLLSFYLAGNSKEYVAIDLSDKGIQMYKNRLEKQNLLNPNVKVYTCDFLSDNFKEEKFDVIYIFSAMHHFKYFEEFLLRLKSFLKDDGCIITYDPAETYLPMYLIRRIYRPFQSDSAWEWPFSRQTYKIILKHFTAEEIQGYLGFSKWSFLFLWIPSRKLKDKLVMKLHQYDLRNAKKFNGDLYRCLHVSFKLKINPK
ncbi:MAG: methyltransferase [Bacteroidetes bacterium B1(2017)]|nr:MAG: methyltransferase [Bacteroidetes bacterium B1(2017)]